MNMIFRTDLHRSEEGGKKKHFVIDNIYRGGGVKGISFIQPKHYMIIVIIRASLIFSNLLTPYYKK